MPPNPALCTVLLADDHRIVREGLKRILQSARDIVVLAEAQSGHEALELARQHRPRVAVVDLSMPGLSGMALIERLRAEFADMAILVLTMHAEEQYALRAFRSGATGYLTKDSAAEELVLALRKVAAGGAYLSPQLAERLALQLNTGRAEELPHTRLTNRELEVFRLIVEGKRLTEIADDLHLSVKTVSTHKSRILEKMGFDNVAALIRYGFQHRLFEAPGENPRAD